MNYFSITKEIKFCNIDFVMDLSVLHPTRHQMNITPSTFILRLVAMR